MNETRAVKLFDMAEGIGTVTNLIAVSDPDVHKFGDQWWMFLGCLQSSNKINLFSASLPPGAPLSSTEWEITTDPSDPHTATPVVEQPEEGRWDEWLHTPNYVGGIDPHAPGSPAARERIYYTGSRGGSSVEERLFSIGVLEKTDSVWVRRDEPVLTGTTDRPCVWEPKVRYYGGKWRIWYLNGPNEAGPGKLPHYQIKYSESDDGLTGWSTPRVLFTEEDNYFDAVVTEAGGGYEIYEMVVATSPNPFGTPGWPTPHGLWWMSADAPSGERSDWSREPVRILDAENGEPWYVGGVYGPSLHYGDAPADSDTLYVFFTGFIDPSEGFSLAVGRTQVQNVSLRR